MGDRGVEASSGRDESPGGGGRERRDKEDNRIIDGEIIAFFISSLSGALFAVVELNGNALWLVDQTIVTIVELIAAITALF